MNRGQTKRKRLARKQKGQCHYCRRTPRKEDRTIDHLIPVSRGGWNGQKNTRMACRKCNLKKNNLTEQEYRHALKGHLLPNVYYDKTLDRYYHVDPSD